MELVLALGIGALAVVAFIVASLIIVAKFRVVPEADEAIVVT